MKNQLLFLLLIMNTIVFAQSPIGIWKSIDDKTGEARSNIEIYKENGKLYGKIIKVIDASPNMICVDCPGKKKNTPIIGLVIIEDLKPYKDYWRKGTILDPESGTSYGCVIWIEKGKLKVRGKHWTGFYRTQTWHSVEKVAAD